MRVLFLGNNRVGLEILRHILNVGEELVGLIVHPPESQRYRHEIVAAAGLPEDNVFSGETLRQPEVIEAIRRLRPEIGLSIFFGHILKSDFLGLFPKGVVNLHPAFLPYNRGQYPNVWSILEGTPAGATIHYVDAGIDTGDIIAQRRATVEPIDTGESLYHKLEACCIDLFRETWPKIKTGPVPRFPQPTDEGTFHRTRDVDAIDVVDLDQEYTARALINILRARTFPPHRGAFFVENGRRVGLKLVLEYEDNEQ